MGKLKSHGVGIEIELKPRHRVGREAHCDLLLRYREVSGDHAEIHWNGEHWEIKDLGSSNGTVVNEDRLEPNEWVSLNQGDRVAFGHFGIGYHLIDASAPK